jgi:hypothetical protein
MPDKVEKYYFLIQPQCHYLEYINWEYIEFNRRNNADVKSLILKKIFIGFEFKPEFDGLNSDLF